MSKEAIGVFDSGVGGLTVVKELIKLLPHENIVYFGDTARVPYGTKSAETILRYSIENAIFLLHHKVKCIVIACHTASAYALEHLQHLFKVPVIGVITSGVETALEKSANKKIAIIGTTATIGSGVYQKEFQRQAPDAEVIAHACPLFVPLVEEGFLDHAATRLLIQEYLNPILESPVDTLLLGCTHYPLLVDQIKEVVGPTIDLVDSAHACAKAVAKALKTKELLGDMNQEGVSRFFVSDDPIKFQSMAVKFFGKPISNIEKASH
jgi:glutamate racemase